VKIGTTQAQRKLFYRISDLPDVADYEKRMQGVAKLAAKINVTEDEVIDMSARMRAHDLSLDDPITDSSRDSFTDVLRDDGSNQEDTLALFQEREELKSWADDALKTLNHRERYILEKRVLTEDPVTLKELGKHFGVTRERARQIEKAALKKLRGSYVKSNSAAA